MPRAIGSFCAADGVVLSAIQSITKSQKQAIAAIRISAVALTLLAGRSMDMLGCWYIGSEDAVQNFCHLNPNDLSHQLMHWQILVHRMAVDRQPPRQPRPREQGGRILRQAPPQHRLWQSHQVL